MRHTASSLGCSPAHHTSAHCGAVWGPRATMMVPAGPLINITTSYAAPWRCVAAPARRARVSPVGVALSEPTTSTATAEVPVPVAVPAALESHQQVPADLLPAIVAPVVDDMERMNANLRSIVGERSPMLMAAADQIFGAGGKKLRPMIVFLVARATAQLSGLE